MLEQKIKNLSNKISSKIHLNYNLKSLNWFNIGGKTKIFFKPENLNDLSLFLKEFHSEKNIFIIGAGSNVLLSDKLYDGVVIKLGKNFSNISLMPNDIIVAKNGDIYFTDPAFAFFDPQKFEFVDSELRELNFNGVFKFNKDNNLLIALDEGPGVPNGLGLSQDEKFLYVNKMGQPFSNTDSEILKINLANNESETLFRGNDLVAKYNNGTDFDGMDVHSSGYIFTAGPGGLLIISPEGELMARINSGQITNCTFNDDESYLYITGFLNNPKLFRIKLK